MVLIFDMDGVLVKSTFFSDMLMKMVCQRFEEHEISMDRTTIFQEILRRFVNKLNAEDKVPAYDWDLLLREYLGEFNVNWECEVEDFFNSDDIMRYSSLYNDVEVLEWLVNKDYNLALLTNGLEKYQNSVVEKLGLLKFFKKIIMPDPTKIKYIKPHPEIFLDTTQGFEGPHTMIGDSLYYDVFGANQVGFNTIWLIRRLPKRYKKLSIADRTEKINQNKKFLLHHILRGVSFLKSSPEQIDLDAFRPNKIICNLNELKELF